MSEQRVFTLVLVTRRKKTDRDPIIDLRALLKLALRRYGLRCTSARELPAFGPQTEINVPYDGRVINS